MFKQSGLEVGHTVKKNIIKDIGGDEVLLESEGHEYASDKACRVWLTGSKSYDQRFGTVVEMLKRLQSQASKQALGIPYFVDGACKNNLLREARNNSVEALVYV